MRASFTQNLSRLLWALAGIAGGVVASQVSPWCAFLFILGCVAGAVGSDIWLKLTGRRALLVALLSFGFLSLFWWQAWVEYRKPETPNMQADFVPEANASRPMSAHISVTNLGKEDWKIVQKRYLLVDGTPLANDMAPQTVFRGRTIRVSIPESPSFIKQVVEPNGKFVFEMTVIPLKDLKAAPLKLTSPFDLADNALSAKVEASTSLPPAPAMNVQDQSEADMFANFSNEKGTAAWKLAEQTANGDDNSSCHPLPHTGALVFDTSRHRLAFTITQAGLRKTMIAHFSHKPVHDVVLYWDQANEDMGLMVDGVDAQEKGAVYAGPWRLACPF